MIVITGVTGSFGRIAAEDVLGRITADRLAVVARTPEKAKAFADRGIEVRRGDYDDPATLETAFSGADRLLLVSSPDVSPGTRPRQHGAAIDAAVRAGVGHVIYTSGITADHAQGFLADHTVTETALRESGLTYTLLRNTFYQHYFINPGLSAALETGELTAPSFGHPLVTATRDDLARAAAAVLTGEGHENTTYELRGTPWTYPELAVTLTAVSGTPVTFREIPDSEVGDDLAYLLPILRLPEFGEPTPDLERLLGHAATSVEEAVRNALGA